MQEEHSTSMQLDQGLRALVDDDDDDDCESVTELLGGGLHSG